MTGISNEINKIVGIRDGAVYVLKETFQYGDKGMRGAVGYSMRPLTQEEIDSASDPQNLRDLWVEDVKADATDLGLNEWVEDLEYNMDSNQHYPLEDTSFRTEFKELLENSSARIKRKIQEAFGVEGEDYVDWSVCSGGRCFSADDKWDEVLNRGALEIIKEFEGE